METTTSPFIGSIPEVGSFAYGGPPPSSSLSQLVGDIISAVFGVLGVVFFVLTVYAGVLWMTAAGDPKKVTKAKDILTQSLIGLIICVLSYGIAYFVTDFASQFFLP
ncbi:MAG: pilin [Patescibacteria group bacterium]